MQVTFFLTLVAFFVQIMARVSDVTVFIVEFKILYFQRTYDKGQKETDVG
jgi:hypothetical protein